jgi:hypothetical protein
LNDVIRVCEDAIKQIMNRSSPEKPVSKSVSKPKVETPQIGNESDAKPKIETPVSKSKLKPKIKSDEPKNEAALKRLEAKANKEPKELFANACIQPILRKRKITKKNSIDERLISKLEDYALHMAYEGPKEKDKELFETLSPKLQKFILNKVSWTSDEKNKNKFIFDDKEIEMLKNEL